MVLIPEALWEALKEQFWETDWPNFKDWLFKKPLILLSLSVIIFLLIYKTLTLIAGLFK